MYTVLCFQQLGTNSYLLAVGPYKRTGALRITPVYGTASPSAYNPFTRQTCLTPLVQRRSTHLCWPMQCLQSTTEHLFATPLVSRSSAVALMRMAAGWT
jgi:hypothetical protein